VQVPLGYFNPVKTVNDLLKSAHQLKGNLKNNHGSFKNNSELNTKPLEAVVLEDKM
jgi:hypothetical protein